MVPANSYDLKAAWSALAADSQPNGGWSTIRLRGDLPRKVYAGVHVPTKTEAVLFAFSKSIVLQNLTLPDGKGFAVELLADDTQGVDVYLAVRKKQGFDLGLFTKMAEDVLNIVNLAGGDELKVARVLLERILAWQEFMRSYGKNCLSEREELGLIGELFVFRLLINSGLSARDVLMCWSGPRHSIHDFVFDMLRIEVKTTIAEKSPIAYVGSLDQLSPLSGSEGALYLAH